MLHEAKSEAIIQWFNILSDGKGVESFNDFSDGSCFASFISVLPSENVNSSLESDDISKEQATASDSSPDKEEREAGRRSKRTANRTSLTKPNTAKKNFEEIQKFIDGFFHVQSSLHISYADCAVGNELQLAKVAVLILSAAVECYMKQNYKKIENTMQLDNIIQDEIKDCLAVCLDDKSSKMDEIVTVLGRSARVKGRRSSVRVHEIKTTDSPLKEFIESPTVYRLAARKQEQELGKLRKSLYFEESRVDELTAEITTLKHELEKTKKAHSTLKSTHQRLQQDYEDLEKAKELVVEDFDSKQSNIKKLKKDIDTLEAENKDYKHTVDTLNKEIDNLRKSQSFKDSKISDLTSEIKKLTAEVNNLNEEIALAGVKQADKNEGPGYKIHTSNMLSEVEQQLRDKTDECNKCHEDLMEERGKTERLKIKLEDVISEKEEAIERVDELMGRVLEAKETKIKLDEQIANYKQLLNQTSSKVVTRATDKLQLGTEIMSKNKPKFVEASKKPEATSPKFGSLWENQKDETPAVPRLTFSEESFKAVRSQLNALVGVFRKNCVMHEEEISPLETSCRKLNSVSDILPVLKDILTLVGSASMLVMPEHAPQAVVPCPTRGSAGKKASPGRKTADKEMEDKYKAFLAQCQEDFKATLKQKEDDIFALKESLKEKKAEVAKITQKSQEYETAATNLAQKYASAKKFISKRESEKKQMQAFCEIYEKAKQAQECSRCDQLKEELRDERRDRVRAEREEAELRTLLKGLEAKNKYLLKEAHELRKQNQELDKELKSNAVFVNGTTSERNALVLQYFKEGVAANKAMEAKKKAEEPKAPVVNVNTYLNLRSSEAPKNSRSHFSVTNSSFRSGAGFFQTDDEEDFLNHSSLAEIQAGPSRLNELQRRNTLCPPHLQSSYPLELANTPSERKYFVPPDEEEEEGAFFIGKRKSSSSSGHASKRRPSTASTAPIVSQPRSRTPLRKAGSTKTFKTPSSVKKLLQRRRRE